MRRMRATRKSRPSRRHSLFLDSSTRHGGCSAAFSLDPLRYREARCSAPDIRVSFPTTEKQWERGADRSAISEVHFFVHEKNLAAVSEVFKRMFEAGTPNSDGELPRIELAESSEVIEALLANSNAYPVRIPRLELEFPQTWELVKCAEKYQVSRLGMVCTVGSENRELTPTPGRPSARCRQRCIRVREENH